MIRSGARVSALVLVLLLPALTAGAQVKPRFGIKGGMNMSTLRGDDLSDLDTRNGIALGVFATLDMPHGFALQPEILYTQWGAKFEPDIIPGEYKWEYRFNYVAINLLARFTFDLHGPVAPIVFVGPSLALSTSSKLEFEHEGESYEFDINNVKGMHLGLVLGGGVQAALHKVLVTLDARYTLGAEGFLEDAAYIGMPNEEVNLVNPDGTAWDSKHGVLSIMLGVAF